MCSLHQAHLQTSAPQRRIQNLVKHLGWSCFRKQLTAVSPILQIASKVHSRGNDFHSVILPNDHRIFRTLCVKHTARQFFALTHRFGFLKETDETILCFFVQSFLSKHFYLPSWILERRTQTNLRFRKPVRKKGDFSPCFSQTSL